MLYFQLKRCVFLLNYTNVVKCLIFGEWSTLSNGGGDFDGGRIFRQHQPPPHHAQGYHIPFGSPLTPINIIINVYSDNAAAAVGASGLGGVYPPQQQLHSKVGAPPPQQQLGFWSWGCHHPPAGPPQFEN